MHEINQRLLVVIPVYNEQEIIGQVLEKWQSALDALKINFEIRCFNDGSKDNTLDVLLAVSKVHSRITVKDKENSGHGGTGTACSIRPTSTVGGLASSARGAESTRSTPRSSARAAGSRRNFEGYAMMLMADMPRAKAARLLRCDEKSMASMLSYWVGKAVDGRSLGDVARLALDETSFRRGHSYVTVAVDADRRRVIDVEEGRDKEAVASFCGKLRAKGGSPEDIVAVTSDMSRSYCPAIAENFPNATHVIDKFHVKQTVTNAMDEVRKEEQKEVEDRKELFRKRKLFFKPSAALTQEQAEEIAALSRRFPKTGRAFRIIASFDDFYRSRSVTEAETAFKRLYSWMRRCRLGPMKRAGETLMAHKDKIMAYFKDHITNAISEGINSLIQAAKRKARGFHTFEGFAAMIYLVAGKLELATPNPFRRIH